jgi:ribose 5-phosphate isomerase B
MQITAKNIYIGCDHAGYEMKEALKKHLIENSIKITDLGCFSKESVDYPDIAREVCEKVSEEKSALGILICGTGIGMMMTANKYPGIRATVCTNDLMAKMSRMHNDANILCLGARIIDIELAKKLLDIFLETTFEDEERHKRRIQKMMATHVPLHDNPDDSC